MNRGVWTRLKNEVAIWRVGALPGVVMIGLVIAVRSAGLLQWLEWRALDQGLRLRPAEPVDERILIVGINEVDIRRAKTYPIPDRDIAALIQKLQTYQPAVIGLDIFRDLPVQPGHAALVQAFRDSKNVIATAKVLPDHSGMTVNPPPTLPPEKVGFADALADLDGVLRRSLLGTADKKGNWHFSLSLRLAETFLATQNIPLSNGIHDKEAMRFGSVELTRFQSNFGGYVGANAGGIQVLLNFRSGRYPFRIVSLGDIQSGQVDPSWIHNRIVLIGITAPSIGDIVNSAAIASDNSSLIYGVEIQAHAISQIVNAVLNQRPLLNVWSEGGEYLWIIGWGILGISLGRFIRAPLGIFLGLAIASITLVGISYGLLLLGWWIPVVPALLVLVLNGAGLAASLFYRYDQDLRFRLQDRQRMIDYMFNMIHNGPLQTLARLLSRAQAQHALSSPMLIELQQLNQELRSVYELVRRDVLVEGDQFYLSHNRTLNLQEPMHEVLCEVYTSVMERELFNSLEVRLITFEPLDERQLNIEQRRSLCWFLEEALCNVGKHAVDATRLEVICTHANGRNLIQVLDNGGGFDASVPEGLGTQQARSLAKQLQGVFVRERRSASETICELSWSARKAWFWQF